MLSKWLRAQTSAIQEEQTEGIVNKRGLFAGMKAVSGRFQNRGLILAFPRSSGIQVIEALKRSGNSNSVLEPRPRALCEIVRFARPVRSDI